MRPSQPRNDPHTYLHLFSRGHSRGAGHYEKLEQIERASEVGSDEEPAEGATCEAKPPVAPGAPPIPLRDDRIVWSKRERLLQPAPEVSISRVIG